MARRYPTHAASLPGLLTLRHAVQVALKAPRTALAWKLALVLGIAHPLLVMSALALALTVGASLPSALRWLIFDVLAQPSTALGNLDRFPAFGTWPHHPLFVLGGDALFWALLGALLGRFTSRSSTSR